jgi:hypothetical protein
VYGEIYVRLLIVEDIEEALPLANLSIIIRISMLIDKISKMSKN